MESFYSGMRESHLKWNDSSVAIGDYENRANKFEVTPEYLNTSILEYLNTCTYTTCNTRIEFELLILKSVLHKNNLYIYRKISRKNIYIN